MLCYAMLCYGVVKQVLLLHSRVAPHELLLADTMPAPQHPLLPRSHVVPLAKIDCVARLPVCYFVALVQQLIVRGLRRLAR